MTKPSLAPAALACALLCAAGAPRPARGRAPGIDPAERRFALVVGNDLGGPGTQPLLYARQDARRMHEALLRLSDVRAEDARLLLGRGASAVWAALGELEARLREGAASGARTQLLFYYSGHARDGVLLLGGDRLPLDALRARLEQSAAQLRVAIVDSCRAGAVTRTKGARRGPAFAIESSASDAGLGNARGTVFLTSSSFDEDSQESDHIGGSYFSHHLIAGLQGAADRSGDGRVTLSEAYEYTYARTVADTAASAAGPQHPTFSYDLKGNGDFVLSHYGARDEGLLLPAGAPSGTYFLVGGGVIAAELHKPEGAARRIALPPGRYTVKRRLPDRLRIGQVDIPRGALVTLDEAALRDAPFSDDPVKGVHRDVVSQLGLNVGAGAQAFFDAPTRDGLFPPAGLLSAELTWAGLLRHDILLGVDLAAGGGQGTVRTALVEAPFRMSQLLVGASLARLWPLLDGDLAPFLGVRLSFLLLSRTFEQDAFAAQHFSTFSPGLVAGARYRLSRRTAAIARVRTHYLHYNVGESRSLGFWEGALALGYDF